MFSWFGTCFVVVVEFFSLIGCCLMSLIISCIFVQIHLCGELHISTNSFIYTSKSTRIAMQAQSFHSGWLLSRCDLTILVNVVLSMDIGRCPRTIFRKMLSFRSNDLAVLECCLADDHYAS